MASRVLRSMVSDQLSGYEVTCEFKIRVKFLHRVICVCVCCVRVLRSRDRCGHCQSLAPAWKKAATALKGVVGVGAVDADSHKQLAGQYGVTGFPTIKIFGANKNKPEAYQG